MAAAVLVSLSSFVQRPRYTSTFKSSENVRRKTASLRASVSRNSRDVEPEGLHSDQHVHSQLPDFRKVSVADTTDYYHELSRKFVDEQLLQIIDSRSNPVRQVVLLTDGTDTRSYRLPWASPSLIFDVSPGSDFDVTAQEVKESGHTFPKSSLLRHVTADWKVEDWVERLLAAGYRGDRPSVWAIQEDLTEGHLCNILVHASCLAMKDSVFLGAISMSSAEEGNTEEMSKLFLRKGFSVVFHVAGGGHSEKADDQNPVHHGKHRSVLFVAQQLRLSEAQVETATNAILEMEEAGTEDGFED